MPMKAYVFYLLKKKISWSIICPHDHSPTAVNGPLIDFQFMTFILDTTRETENLNEQLILHKFIKFCVDKSTWYWLLVHQPVLISSKVIGSNDEWVKHLSHVDVKSLYGTFITL